MNEDEIKYIIARVISNANDAIKEHKNSPDNDFYDGKTLAYYEVLDTIKNELSIRNQDLSQFGLDINLEKWIL